MNKYKPTKHLKNIGAIAIKIFSSVKRYVTFLVGVGFLVAVLVFWQELEQREVTQIEQKLAMEAASIKIQLTQQIEGRILDLARMAKRWENEGKPNQKQWVSEAALHTKDFRGYRAIGWVDPSFQLGWIVPAEKEKVPKQKLSWEQQAQLKKARKTGADPIAIMSGSEFLRVYVPIFLPAQQAPVVRDGKEKLALLSEPKSNLSAKSLEKGQNVRHFGGFILGIFSIKQLLDAILPENLIEEYEICIYNRNEEIYSRHQVSSQSKPTFIKTIQIYLNGIEWQVEISPTSKLLARDKSFLPKIILSAGILIYFAIAAILCSIQRQQKRTKTILEINQKLQLKLTEYQIKFDSLLKKQHKYKYSIECIDGIVWAANIQSLRFTFVSQKAETLLGYPVEKWLTEPNFWEDIIHPDDRDRVINLYLETSKEKSEYQLEYRTIAADGRIVWLRNTIAVTFVNEIPIEMQGVMVDITTYKQTEVELRESEALLRTMANVSPLAFYVVDPRTDTILYFNDRFGEIWGIEDLEEPMQLGKLKNSDIILQCLPQLVNPKEFFESCDALQDEENRMVIEDEIQLTSGITLRRFSAQIRDRSDCYFGRLYIFEDVTQRKRSEQELKEAKERFELAICASNDGFWDWQLTTGKIYFSHRWKEMIGYKNYELPNELYSWEKVIFEEDRIAALKMLDDYNSGRIPRFLTTQRFRHKNGSTVYILARAIHLKDTTGKVVRMIGAHTDITELINIQEQLSKSEKHTRALLDAIPDMMFCLRSDGTYLDFKGKESELLIPADKSIGNNLLNSPLAEEDKIYLLNLIKIASQTGELQTYEHEVRGQQDTRNYESRIVKSSEEEVVWIVRDITERKQAEKALKESQHFIARVADASPNILYIYDLVERRIAYANSETIEILGYTPQELKEMGANFFTHLAHPAYLTHINEHLNKFDLAKDGEVIEIEYRLKHRSGEWRWLYSRDTIFTRTADGKPRQILGNTTDITKRKQMEEALYQANQQLQSWVKKLEERNQEIIYLGQLNDVLQACLTVEEAYGAIAQMMQPLFPEMSGAIFTISASRKLVEAVATWGTEFTSNSIFTPNECWGLRRGREYFVADTSKGLTCKHLHAQSLPIESICIPMMAQGEAIGMLYLSTERLGQLTEQKQILARTVSEHIAMALANLRLRETLQHQSIRDPLTGLFNRRYLEESLEREIHRADRKQQSVGIIMLDVDRFKRFNDTYGHDAGDAVLRELGVFLQRYIRGSDIACRYGGEELTLILPEASLEVTSERAEQLRQGVKHLNVYHHSEALGIITLSLGVAVFPTHGVTGEAVIQSADNALYRAKKEGRDRVITAS